MPIWTSVVTGSLHRQGAVPASLGADVHQEDRAGWGRYHVVWGDIGGNVALYGRTEAIPKTSSVLLGNKCFRKDEVETKSWILSCEKGQLFVLRLWDEGWKRWEMDVQIGCSGEAFQMQVWMEINALTKHLPADTSENTSETPLVLSHI